MVLTASYEARPYGVGSAMPVARARRLCPNAIMVPPRFERYQEVSACVMDVLGDFSPSVEALSLDEAFLDMSGASHIFGPPNRMARRIKDAVRDATGLDISVGVSTTKYVAKVASAYDKPNGLTVVPPELGGGLARTASGCRGSGAWVRKPARGCMRSALNASVISPPPIRARSHCNSAHSVRTCISSANAVDPRRVARGRSARSIGSDRTLSVDVSTREDIERHLLRAAERIARRVRGKDYLAGGVRVRLKTSRFEMLTRQIQLARPDDTAQGFFAAARKLLTRIHHPGPFRLVGMAAFDLHWRTEPRQTDLFEANTARNLETTIDALIERFGKGTLVRARDLGGGSAIFSDGVNLDYLDYRDGERVSAPANSR